MEIIDRDSGTPPWEQLRDILRAAIASGEITGRLPSARRIGQEQDGLAVNTVTKALAALRDEGLIRARKGWGWSVVPEAERDTRGLHFPYPRQPGASLMRRMCVRSHLPAAALAALFLAACGSSAPPSAAALAAKIHGCSSVTVNTPAVIETQDITCTLPNQDQIEIATFPSAADETQWISDGGSPSAPDPGYIGCCVQGSGWAATIDGYNDILTDYWTVMHAIGGREVSG